MRESEGNTKYKEDARKVKIGYRCGKKGLSLNQLLFMDDLKLFGKFEKRIDSLTKTVQKESAYRELRLPSGEDHV
ncbi:Hypothetical predicted protein [Octopus vulgaris]|uniref:Uncharacterized protein n=1 Tax=Octopus vulgaris TaxID=6645 RepID=A0AA36FIS2_OCTVU|nr:Hypothetical predicted protein [Octopus vulgaris]